MSVPGLTQVDPQQFFNPPSMNGREIQRLDTQVSGVAVSHDFSGRLSVTTAEGDTITLSADLESDFRAVNDKSYVKGDGKTMNVEAKVDSHKVRKYLPDFFEKLREDLGKQLRGERDHKSDNHNQPANQVQTQAATSASVAFAYREVSQTSVSLSIHS
jgi:hypothetical protein